MKNTKSSDSIAFIKFCLIALGIALILRLCSMGAYPLFDTTEARYAGMSLEMLKSGDWITPSMPVSHEAFLAKPVLSFWLTAISFKFLGVNEFAARLPNFIETLLILFFTYLIARKFYNKLVSLLAPCILFSCGFIFIQAGSVDLDVLVCLVNIASFWVFLCIQQAARQNKQKQKLLYELLMGFLFSLSLLNKGLIGLVLFGGSLAIYALWTRSWKNLFQANWVLVLLVGVLLAAPWYYLAELQNPGFLKYFFLNEHLYRYIKRDCGDRYGNPHNKPYGSSWIFMLGAFMPWSPFVLPIINSFFSNKKTNEAKIFLLSCVIFPPLFFTFGRSILMNYILASLPPLAILVSHLVIKSFRQPNKQLPLTQSKNWFVKLWDFLANPIYASFPALVSSSLVMVIILSIYYSRYSFGLHSREEKLELFVLMVTLAVVVTVAFLFVFYKLLPKINLRKFAGFAVSMTTLAFPISLTVWFLFLSQPLAEQKSMKLFVSRLQTEIPNFANYSINSQDEKLPASWFFYSAGKYSNLPLQSKDSPDGKTITFVEQSNLDKYCETNPARCKDKYAFKEHKYFVFKP